MNPGKLRYLLCILLAAFFWGTAGIFVRTATNIGLTEMQIVFGRAFNTVLILFFIILFSNKKSFSVKVKDLPIFACSGLFSIILFNFSYYKAMALSTLSIAAVLLYTAPFFVIIISALFFKEKLSSQKIGACLTAFIGCCFVSGVFSSVNRISEEAIIFGLLTGLGYGLYTIFSEILLKKGYNSLTITFYVFLFAAVFLIPFVNIGKTVTVMFSDTKPFLTVFLMALINTVLPYLLYTTGLREVEITIAPVVATLEPVVATVIGAMFFHERITVSGIFGMALVLGSVIILNYRNVKMRANAKINLLLAVTGKRHDGYHTVDMIMQTVSLSDTVKVKPYKELKVICDDEEIDGEKNIAYTAAKLFFEKTGINGGALIKIKKRIPKAAGLGGGSTDAAAVLLALNKIYNTNLTNAELEELALKLGADVPFFIEGGTKRAEGIGEILTPLKPLKKCYFVLAKGESKKSTSEMYKKIDNESPALPNVDDAVKAIEAENLEDLVKLMDNSFSCIWGKSAIKKQLQKLDADCVSLSGSGPTWFACFFDKQKAKKAYKELKEKQIECYFTKLIMK